MRKIKLNKEEAEEIMNIIANEKDDEMVDQIDTNHMTDSIDDSEIPDNTNVIPFVYVGDKRTATHQLHEIGLNFSKARNEFLGEHMLSNLTNDDLDRLDNANNQIHVVEVTNYIIDDAVQVFMSTLYYSNFARIYGPEICNRIVHNVNKDLLNTDDFYYKYLPFNRIMLILGHVSSNYLFSEENDITSERYDALIYSIGLQIISILIDQINRSVDNAINYSCNYLMYNTKARFEPSDMYKVKNAFLTEVSPLVADRISDNVNRILVSMNNDNYKVFGNELSRRNENHIGKNNDNR